eukprot:COSAG06_NODE_5053_length_3759_cov_2.454645_4_plen_182_part_00
MPLSAIVLLAASPTWSAPGGGASAMTGANRGSPAQHTASSAGSSSPAAPRSAASNRPMAVAWFDATAGMVQDYPVSAIPWSNLTHIVYNGGFQPYTNGTLAMGQDIDCEPSGCVADWNCGADAADCVRTLHALRDAAHAHGVKVLIGGLDLFEGNTSLAYAWLNSTCPSPNRGEAALPCIE